MPRTRKGKELSEEALGALVVQYLLDDGWEVFQEVALGSVADIVVTRKTREGATLLGVVEVKTSLSLTLLAQAHSWKGNANVIWIAYPKPKWTKSAHFGLQVASQNHLGVLHITPGGVSEYKPPGLARKRNDALLDQLRPEHQEGYAKAGARGGGHYTPFKATVQRLQAVVRNQPGITLREAVLASQHHYTRNSTAIACLAKYLRDGVIDGIIEKVDDQGKVSLYPTLNQKGQGLVLL